MTQVIRHAAQRRLFVIDDHPIIQEGLRQLVCGESDLCVCGEASGARDTLDQLAAADPDLVILDLNLAQHDGLEILQNIRTCQPAIPVLIYSMSEEELYAEQCLKKGANGYLMKKEDPRLLLKAVRTILDGKVYLSEAMKETLVLSALQGHQRAADKLSALTTREMQVFRLLAEGRKTRDIGSQLNISSKTVHTHIENMKKKLSLPDLRSLLLYAMKNALGVILTLVWL